MSVNHHRLLLVQSFGKGGIAEVVSYETYMPAISDRTNKGSLAGHGLEGRCRCRAPLFLSGEGNDQRQTYDEGETEGNALFQGERLARNIEHIADNIERLIDEGKKGRESF